MITQRIMKQQGHVKLGKFYMLKAT